MIIIIVAIVIVLVNLYFFLRRRIKFIREEEKVIYDVIFVREFFSYVKSSQDWTSFFSRDRKFLVDRRVFIARASKMSSTRANSVYVETKSNFSESQKLVCCVEYIFDDGEINIKLYAYLPYVYRSMLAKMKDTTFSFEIKSKARKIIFVNSFDDKIYFVSKQTLFQGLAFALERRVQGFKDMMWRCLDFMQEFDETRLIGVTILKRWQSPN